MPYFTRKGTGKNKGKTCVYKKTDRSKVGCTSGPIQKYLAALHIHESSDELDWMRGPVKVSFGELISDKELLKTLNVGDVIYLSGILVLDEMDRSFDVPLDEEPVTIIKISEYGFIEVDLIGVATNDPNWTTKLSTTELQLGILNGDLDLIITLPKKLNESNNGLDWMSGPVTVRLSEIVGDEERMGEYFKKDQKIFVTGHFILNDFDRSMDIFIENEPAVVLNIHKSLLRVKFIGDITKGHSWGVMIPNDEVYLGSFNEDLDLIITFPTSNLNESEGDDWDWAREIKPKEPLCNVVDSLKIGDKIILEKIKDWTGSKRKTHYDVEAKVLRIDSCNKIQTNNFSKSLTVLVKINSDDYRGFDEPWISDFTYTSDIDECSTGRCMFLICDEDHKEILITRV